MTISEKSSQRRMREVSLLARSKETDKKLRWAADVDGALFELYVPKDQVPKPWSGSIDVEIWGPGEENHPPAVVRSSLEEPIFERVRRYRNHTQTVRYQPVGDSPQWQLGEPYIPYILLASPPQHELLICIRWDQSVAWEAMV